MMKSSLRQHYRQLRRQISATEKIQASQSLRALFFKNFSYAQKNIAVYLSQDGELDLQFLIQQLWKEKCHVFLPVLETDDRLKFTPYFSSSIMKKNGYGIFEPESDFFILPEQLDIVLLPLVAFDKTGARLGMGKGYYDKSFTFRRKSFHQQQLIGVAYACQCCDKLPTDDWDVPLDGILTEKELVV